MKAFLRKLPHFRGKFRLVKLLYRRVLQTGRDEIINGKFNLSYLLPNLKENIAFEIFSDGIYEPETSALIAEKLPPGGVLLDIGANIGSIAMPVCSQRPDIKAICVEASPQVFKYLEKNIAVNKLDNCILINRIISDKDDAEVDFFSPAELFGKGSMSPSFTTVSEKLRTITVDSLLQSLNFHTVHFIKIDIEGYEYYAFKGAAGILTAQDAPDILFEFLDCAETEDKNLKAGDAQQLLMQYGYTLWVVSLNKLFTKIEAPLQVGEAMIFATKKQNFADTL